MFEALTIVSILHCAQCPHLELPFRLYMREQRLSSDVLKHRLSTQDVPKLPDNVSNFCRAVIKVNDKMCPWFFLFLCVFGERNYFFSYFCTLKGINHL